MRCPILEIGWMQTKVGAKGQSSDCLKEECAWWDDSDEYCYFVDIASSLSMIMSFLKDITENGIPRRGG